MATAPVRTGVLAAIAAVALLSLYGSLNYYQFLSAYRNTAAVNQFARLQERFSDASTLFPRSARIGYLSDVPPGQDAMLLHGAAQYALAPRVLDTTADPRREWFLGDFYQPYDAARTARERGLAIVRDFGTGVVVFRKAAR